MFTARAVRRWGGCAEEPGGADPGCVGPGPPEGEARARPALRHRAPPPLRCSVGSAPRPPPGVLQRGAGRRRDRRGVRPVRGAPRAERPISTGEAVRSGEAGLGG